jgi:hypothetical protein
MRRLAITALALASVGAALLATPCLAAQHRSRAVTEEFQRLHPCPSTGKKTGACPGWVKDHRIALCKGGADAVWNLQWQAVPEAKAKDKWSANDAAPTGRTMVMWIYDERLRVFTNGEYEIDRDSCVTCDGLLDWVFNVANKPWCSNEDLGQLIRLMDEVIDPQGTMCSFGIDMVKGKPAPDAASEWTAIGGNRVAPERPVPHRPSPPTTPAGARAEAQL